MDFSVHLNLNKFVYILGSQDDLILAFLYCLVNSDIFEELFSSFVRFQSLPLEYTVSKLLQHAKNCGAC